MRAACSLRRAQLDRDASRLNNNNTNNKNAKLEPTTTTKTTTSSKQKPPWRHPRCPNLILLALALRRFPTRERKKGREKELSGVCLRRVCRKEEAKNKLTLLLSSQQN